MHVEWSIFSKSLNRRGSTFSSNKRKIARRLRVNQNLEGILVATYIKNDRVVGTNKTKFRGLPDCMEAIAKFEEQELLDFLDRLSENTPKRKRVSEGELHDG
jgi:hypothetical protein